MAIDGIKNNIMTQQVNRVSEPVKVAEADTSLQSNIQQMTAVSERQQGYDRKDENGKNQKDDEGKNLQEVSANKIKSALADINKKIAPTHTQCEFKYHELTHRISITVKDKDTDKVIREIPPEKTLDMLAKTLELAGILVDEKR